MTRLVCVCGAVIEGSDDELLDAVERHLDEAHDDGATRTSEHAGVLRRKGDEWRNWTMSERFDVPSVDDTAAER